MKKKKTLEKIKFSYDFLNFSTEIISNQCVNASQSYLNKPFASGKRTTSYVKIKFSAGRLNLSVEKAIFLYGHA